MVLRRDYGDYRWAMTQLFAQVDPWGFISGSAGAVGISNDSAGGRTVELLGARPRNPASPADTQTAVRLRVFGVPHLFPKYSAASAGGRWVKSRMAGAEPLA